MNGMQKPTFIVGIRRSGSTLWRRILEQNKEIAVFGEMQFLWPWERDFSDFLKRDIGDLSNDKNVLKMIEIIFSNPPLPHISFLKLRWGFWESLRKINDKELRDRICSRILNSDRSIESIFKALTEETTKHLGYDRFAIKFPVYFNHIPTLLKWYPNAKIVHITRDPRAIAASKKNDPGGTAKLKAKYPKYSYLIEKAMTVFVIFQYNWSAKVHNKYKYLKNYKLFKYEDLLWDPKNTIRELCNFSDLQFKEEMLSPSKGRVSSIDGRKRSGFDKRAAYRWKEKLTPLEEKIVTLFTKRSMKILEYNPSIHPIFQEIKIYNNVE